MFAIETATPVTVRGVNVRSETHGTEHVPAIDIHISWMTSNTVLDQFDPALLPMFYTRPEAPDVQGQLAGTEITTLPLLRSSKLDGPIRLKGEFAGYSLCIQHGIDESTAITIPNCKLAKIAAMLNEGGSAGIGFRLQASNIEPEVLGLVASMIGLEKTITLLPPNEVQGGLIDASSDGDFPGSSSGEPVDERDATDIFADRG